MEKEIIRLSNRENVTIEHNGYKNYLLDNDGCEAPVKQKEKEIDTNNSMTQWSSIDGKIIPVSNTFDKLEAGYYTIGFSDQLGMYIKKTNIEMNKLYRLPNSATTTILNDIDKFWTLEETYKRYQRVFKRNYLLYSAPGTGKTSLINIMCEDLIEKYGGIVFSLSTEQEISNFPDLVTTIRKIEPTRKIICVIEDIDNFCDYRQGKMGTLLLNILDGNLKQGGVVTIATTNYIERMEERYTNRPTRFDRVVEFPLPNAESRKIFIEKTVLPDDLKKIDVDKWVQRTKGFSIDHLNELILLVLVFGHDEEEAFETMEKMVNGNSTLRNSESIGNKQFGFEDEE